VGHAHAHAHQFDDAGQQSDAINLGMWVFLVTEIMFFGGLFAGYTIYRVKYPEAFSAASRHLDIELGAINTAILISSSLSMALAVWAAAKQKRGLLVAFIFATIVFGSAFLGIKAYEYHHKFVENLVPGPLFDASLTDSAHQQLFFSFYFAMTGLHAAHMVIGIGIMLVLLYPLRVAVDDLKPARWEVMGLYWHFVDIVWIFLFPLLYLIGRH
jgi:cytochrome c oxidase subunit 3